MIEVSRFLLVVTVVVTTLIAGVSPAFPGFNADSPEGARRVFTQIAAATGTTARAELTSPAPGSTLTASTVTFQWTGGTGVSRYWLYVGSTAGGNDLFGQDQGTNLSATVAGLPTDGRTLYVRLWSFIGGAWQFSDYTYRAATSTTARAELTSPAPGSTLTASTVTFQWTGGTGVTHYWLYVGSTAGGNDLFGQDQGTNLSATVAALPTDGRTLYVRLWSLIGGAWQFNDYTYRAATSTTARAELSSPAPGSTLTASTVTFQWTGGTGVSRYWLYVGSTVGGNNLFNQDQGTNLSATVAGLPTDGRTLYVRLWSLIGGAWQFNDYTYRAVTASPPPSGGATAANFKVAFIGDQGMVSDTRAVLQLIANEGTDMVLISGDFDYEDNPDGWDQLLTDVLGADFPIFASVGNHDEAAWTGYQQKLQARLARVPGAVCVGDLGVQATCTYQGLFFLLTGAGTMGSGHDVFIRDQLAQDNSIWSVCSWHKNMAAMQVGGKSDETGWEVYEECRKGGGIVATAHEHSYERTKTLSNISTQTVDARFPDPNVVHVMPGATFGFVSGLGGRSIRDQLRCLPATYPYGCNGEWASIYTNNQNAQSGALFITFHVDGDPRKARGEFKNISGEVVDSFIIWAH